MSASVVYYHNIIRAYYQYCQQCDLLCWSAL